MVDPITKRPQPPEERKNFRRVIFVIGWFFIVVGILGSTLHHNTDTVVDDLEPLGLMVFGALLVISAILIQIADRLAELTWLGGFTPQSERWRYETWQNQQQSPPPQRRWADPETDPVYDADAEPEIRQVKDDLDSKDPRVRALKTQAERRKP